MKQQAEREKELFLEMVSKRDQEHKKQLESMKGEMEQKIQNLQEVCTLHTAFMHIVAVWLTLLFLLAYNNFYVGAQETVGSGKRSVERTGDKIGNGKFVKGEGAAD